MYIQSQLPVDDAGTVLGYIDSGIPTINADSYTTIFALHGSLLGAGTFSRIISLASSFGVRIVAISRRGYQSSTPINRELDAEVTNGTDEQKYKFITDRGVELVKFIDVFIQKNAIPPLSGDKESGGIALLGWSSGTFLASAFLALPCIVPNLVGEKLRNNLKAVILFDPISLALGLPTHEKAWNLATVAPPGKKADAFLLWISCYFDHGDLTRRDPDVISFVAPSLDKQPSCFNLTGEDRARILDERGFAADAAQDFVTQPQRHAIYMKAFYDKAAGAFWGNLDIWVTYSEKGVCYGILTSWDIEKDNEAQGGGFVSVKPIPGANHLMQWDEPERFLKFHMELLKKHQ